jgi:hypothetical protein
MPRAKEFRSRTAHSWSRRSESAVPKIARISDKDGRMVWGEAVGLFGIACFWALTLFMVFREPAA